MVLGSLVRVRIVVAGSFFLASLLMVGCGSKSQLGTIEGKVTVDDVAANAGDVTFTVDGKSFSGRIQADGTYRAIDVPLGTATVSVSAPAAAPAGMAGKAAPTAMKDGSGMTGGPTKSVAIPAKYATADKSGLSTPVKSGTNTYNIPLTSK